MSGLRQLGFFDALVEEGTFIKRIPNDEHDCSAWHRHWYAAGSGPPRDKLETDFDCVRLARVNQPVVATAAKSLRAQIET